MNATIAVIAAMRHHDEPVKEDASTHTPASDTIPNTVKKLKPFLA